MDKVLKMGDVVRINIESQSKVCIIIDKRFGRNMDDRPHSNFFQRYEGPSPTCNFYIQEQNTCTSDWFHVFCMTMFYELMYGDEKAYMRSDILEKYVGKV